MKRRNERQRAYYEANREKIISSVSAWAKSNPDRIAQYRKTRAPKLREYHQKHYLANRDAIRAKNKARQHLYAGAAYEKQKTKRAAARLVVAEQKARFRLDYAAEIQIASVLKKELVAAVRRKRRRERYHELPRVRLQRRVECIRRRGVKRNAKRTHDIAGYRAFVKHVSTAEKLSCYWCGKPTRRGKRHVDHIISLSSGGADDVHNLCCSCPSCNFRKHNKPPEAFSGQYELKFI